MSYESIILEHKNIGGILDVLKAIQEKDGYLSEESIKEVATAYGRFPSEVYETATFYSMLKVGKKADHVIQMCGSTCCDAANAADVAEAIKTELHVSLGTISEDGKWQFKRCECLGRCDTAPNVLIDDELITNATAEGIVDAIRKAGK